MEIAGKTAVTASSPWDCLRGQILDSRFETGTLLQLDRNGALFRGRDLVESEEVILFLENEDQPGAAADFDRFREAAFLSHPNLVRVLAAGRVACGDRNFVYIATETAQSDLSKELLRRPMNVEEAGDLLRQLASGLAYLHSENLTSCAVRCGAVWRVNGHWKLADYTQLRVPGQYPIQETRRLLLNPGFECPPEANEGLVSPAWDVWSLGSVLGKVFARAGRAKWLPSPFDSIVRSALDPQPDARPSLETMLDELSADGSSASQGLPQAVAIAAPDENRKALEEELEEEKVARREPAVPQVRPRVPARGGTLRDYRAPVIAGALLAAAVAGILAVTLPIRLKHQETVPTPAPPAAQLPAPPVVQPEPQEQTSHSPFGDTNAGASAAPQAQRDISAMLNKWADAKRHRNVDEEIDCYAPSVDRFYGQRSVSAGQLKREEQNVFSRIGTVQRFDISNLKFNRVNPDWAVVSFDKNWDFRGRTRFAGSSREELVMRPVSGHWKISSQREVKVYWVDKQPSNSKPRM